MMRAVGFILVPAALAGAGAAMLHRNGTSAPIAATSPAGARAADTPLTVEPTVVGMNLGGLEYYAGEWAFNDIVQTSATINFIEPNGSWKDPIGRIQFDPTGHPIHIPKTTLLSVMLQSGTVRIQTGSFACTIADGWDVYAFGDWKTKGSGKHFTMIVDKPIPTAGITMKLTATKDDATLSPLSCVQQGVDTSTPFNPVFLAEKRPYKVLRFMDWMQTNNAPKRIWAERPTPASFTQGGPNGVSMEYMVALANTTQSDPWFNMPFDVDPGYYEKFATYVRDHLDPKLKAYVEFSNEVWNDAFQQGKTATERGRELYPNVDPAMANDFYYADRVRDVMSVWTRVFSGQPKRLVRVLANQTWPERADRALAHKDTWRSVDALAVAPYFSTDPYTLPGTGAVRVNALFARAPEIVGNAINQAVAAKKVAHKYNLPMVAYEAGPGFVGYQKEIGEDMLAANRDPRIYDMYMTYLKRWQKEVGGLIVLFTSVGTPGPGGQYGHREYTGQPLSDAPKARAVNDFMAQLKQ
ncbi:hypothetical protein ASG11_07915 [Sphingomonas sp. Leaf357]|nr:hypothetical protein ASG11_07915 [Sphingomonas sp. Leaf357]